jgi:hypothetical protein
MKTYSCACGETKTEAIPATGHTVVIDPAVSATCTKAGKTEGSHCSVCGTILVAQATVAMTDHTWNAGVVTEAATCTTTGVKTYTCSSCQTTKTEAIPTTDHTWVIDHWELLDGSVANIGDRTPWEVYYLFDDPDNTTYSYTLIGYNEDGTPHVVRTNTNAAAILAAGKEPDNQDGAEFSSIYYSCAVIKEDGTVATNNGYECRAYVSGVDCSFKVYFRNTSFALSGDEENVADSQATSGTLFNGHFLDENGHGYATTGSFRENIYQIITPSYECSVCGTSK